MARLFTRVLQVCLLAGIFTITATISSIACSVTGWEILPPPHSVYLKVLT